jgi:hypothetical protein
LFVVGSVYVHAAPASTAVSHACSSGVSTSALAVAADVAKIAAAHHAVHRFIGTPPSVGAKDSKTPAVGQSSGERAARAARDHDARVAPAAHAGARPKLGPAGRPSSSSDP